MKEATTSSSVSVKKGKVNRGLTMEMEEDARECFKMYDKGRTGKVSTKRIGELMMSLGFNPTFEELEKYKKSYSKGTISIKEFISLLKRVAAAQSGEMGVERAFVLYDRLCSGKPNSGTITINELECIMCRVGDKLKPDEWEAMRKFAKVAHDGTLDYKAFTRRLLKPKATT